MTPLRLPYQPWPQAHDHLLARVLHRDYLVIDEGWNSRSVRSSFWRLYVNSRRGAAITYAGGERHPITPYRVHIIPAWVRFNCVGTHRLRHLYLHFDVAGLPGPLVRDVFQAPAALSERSPAYQLAEQVAEVLCDGAADDLAALCLCKSLVYLGLAELVQSLPVSERSRCQRRMLEPAPVAPALRHVEGHLGAPIENAELAECCSLSPDHFTRVFRKLIGQTPAQYVLERRIAVAAQRLAYTDDTIERIAHEVGFANRFHFTAAFSKRMGVSPAAYRKLPRA